MKMRALILAGLPVLMLTGPAPAQDQTPPAGSAPGPGTSLACTNSGLHYQVGEYACIAACHGQRRLARCDAVSERTTWTYISESCPTTMINPPWPSEWSEVPAIAAMSPKPVNVNRSAIPPDERLAFATFEDGLTATQ